MQRVLLVGTGQMAIDYAKVLEALEMKVVVIGRGAKSAENFTNVTGYPVTTGGIEQYLANNQVEKNTWAIVATGTENLMSCTLNLLESGIEKVLVEKPAAISINELINKASLFKPYEDSVFVAYNRRFYSSVLEAEKLIKEDEGLRSLHFEFTEWAHTIAPLKKAEGVKENWFFANSTHVVDLAFSLGGRPKHIKAFSKNGDLSWHKKSRFVGCGETEKGVLFSYISDWESAGRWGIELLTKNRRIYLKPMEEIKVQKLGSVSVVNHQIDSSLDQNFKPGLFLQTKAFLSGSNERLLSLEEHVRNTKEIYSEILEFPQA